MLACLKSKLVDEYMLYVCSSLLERKDSEYKLAVDDKFVTPRGNRNEHAHQATISCSNKSLIIHLKILRRCVCAFRTSNQVKERKVIVSRKKGDLLV